MIELMLLPLLAALGLAVATGPLGCFVVWNRMSYFGDTLAHSGLLGVTLGLALSTNTLAAVLFTCCAVAVLLWVLQKNTQLGNDSILGILSHSTLAMGLIGVGLLNNNRIDIFGLLFGDILTVTAEDITIICFVSALSILLVISQWRKLLLFVTDADLAKVEGTPVAVMRLMVMILVALVIATAMRVVGVLLITALLIIPAAAARYHSRSPEAMALLATFLGIIAVILGLSGAYYWNLPVGPSIVVSASLLFTLSAVCNKR